MDRLPKIDSLNIEQGDIVLAREDLNITLDKNGNPESKFRIHKIKNTVDYLVEKGAKTLLCSHLEHKKQNPSLEFLVPVLCNILGIPEEDFVFIENYLHNDAGKIIDAMKPGQVALFENLRLNPGEKKNDGEYTTLLARYADFLVMDAFGALHRPHASIVGLPMLPQFKGKCAIGKLVEKELKIMDSIKKNPKAPMLAIIGGAKLNDKKGDKLGAINKLLENPDCKVLLGGLPGFFVARANFDVDDGPNPKEILEAIQQLNVKSGRIIWPIDFSFHGGKDMPLSPMDIGPKTIELYCEEIRNARTIFTNGPVGFFEGGYLGTEKILRAIAENQKAKTVAGGGDTISAIERFGLSTQFDEISTGGGAFLNFLADGTLVGLEAVKASIV